MCRLIVLCFWNLLGLALSVNAASRSAGEALRVARSFYEGKSLLRSVSESDLRLVYTGKGGDLRSSSNDPYYYIYNVREDGGFVMVSGDDRVVPVIGYSLDGSFRPDDMPPSLRGWLGEYERQIDYIRALLERPYPTEVSSLRVDENLPDRVESLIQTKWGQEVPFNDRCPLVGNQRTLTGCGATALAQVMNYHQWPEKAYGTGSYTVPELGEDTTFVYLEGCSFDWANMRNVYDSGFTKAESDVVAELMRVAGAAICMSYGLAGSEALYASLAKGLVDHLGYDKNASLLIRSMYSAEEWRALMKAELSADRPLLYMAQSTMGGHLFICDGYDEQSLFHINWGWDGNSDGFFMLDLLWPYDAASGNLGFSWAQAMVAGIQKPTGQSRPYEDFRLNLLGSEQSEIACGDTLVYTYLYSYGGHTVADPLELSVDLYQEGEWVRQLSVIREEDPIQLESVYGQTLMIPDFHLEAGTYDLILRYRLADDPEWVEMPVAHDAIFDCPRLISDGVRRMYSRGLGDRLLLQPRGGVRGAGGGKLVCLEIRYGRACMEYLSSTSLSSCGDLQDHPGL